jgi:PPP family 3-phenylpropionic acid transporter
MTPLDFSLRLSLFSASLYLGSGIQLPFLPLWLKDRGLDAGEIGAILAAMTAIRVLSMPVGTFLADLHGHRRRVIVAGATTAFLCFLLMAAMPGFGTILLCGTLAAALFAPVPPLAEVLAIEGSRFHGLDYGRIRLWASLSFLAGSLLSGAMLEVVATAQVIFLIAAAQGLAAALALVLPDDPPQASRDGRPVQVAAVAAVLATPPFLIFMAAAGLGQASHGFIYAFGSVHWDSLGYGKLAIGGLWAVGVLAEVVMFAFSNRIHRRIGSVHLIAAGAACGLLRWLAIGAEPPLPVLFLAQLLHAGSFGFTHLGTMHYVRETVPENMRNTAQGVYAALSGGVLLAVSMWGAGPLYGSLGGRAYFVMAGASAAALALALVLARISPTDRAAAET